MRPLLTSVLPPRARARASSFSTHFSEPSQSIAGPRGSGFPSQGCHTGALHPEACGCHPSTDRSCSLAYGTPRLGQQGIVSTPWEPLQGPPVPSRERSEQRVRGLSAKEGKRGTPRVSLPKAEETRGSLSAMPVGTLSVREPVQRGSRWGRGQSHVCPLADEWAQSCQIF